MNLLTNELLDKQTQRLSKTEAGLKLCVSMGIAGKAEKYGPYQHRWKREVPGCREKQDFRPSMEPARYPTFVGADPLSAEVIKELMAEEEAQRALKEAGQSGGQGQGQAQAQGEGDGVDGADVDAGAGGYGAGRGGRGGRVAGRGGRGGRAAGLDDLPDSGAEIGLDHAMFDEIWGTQRPTTQRISVVSRPTTGDVQRMIAELDERTTRAEELAVRTQNMVAWNMLALRQIVSDSGNLFSLPPMPEIPAQFLLWEQQQFQEQQQREQQREQQQREQEQQEQEQQHREREHAHAQHHTDDTLDATHPLHSDDLDDTLDTSQLLSSPTHSVTPARTPPPPPPC